MADSEHGSTERECDEDFAILCFNAAGFEVESHPAVLRFKKNRVVLNLWIEGDGARSWSLESLEARTKEAVDEG